MSEIRETKILKEHVISEIRIDEDELIVIPLLGTVLDDVMKDVDFKPAIAVFMISGIVDKEGHFIPETML